MVHWTSILPSINFERVTIGMLPTCCRRRCTPIDSFHCHTVRAAVSSSPPGTAFVTDNEGLSMNSLHNLLRSKMIGYIDRHLTQSMVADNGHRWTHQCTIHCGRCYRFTKQYRQLVATHTIQAVLDWVVSIDSQCRPQIDCASYTSISIHWW